MLKTKLVKYGLYTVYIVDGHAVRNSSLENEEFGEFAIHNAFPLLIPENEIWIEDSVSQRERQFLIANALFQLKLLAGGMNKNEAYDKALEYEKQLRENYNKKQIDIKVKILFTYGLYTIWLVNGQAIRDKYKIDFIEGGNHSAYDFIPDGDIWIEYSLHPDEYSYIIGHEVVEDIIMHNRRLDYYSAHRLASKIEYILREKYPDITLNTSIPLAITVLKKVMK